MKKALGISVLVVVVLSVFAFAQDTGGMMTGGMMDMTGGMVRRYHNWWLNTSQVREPERLLRLFFCI